MNITHLRTTKLLIGIAVATAALAGCGKVLDYRNAQINNGSIYDGNANEPFSGKVTNAPYGQVFADTDGLGKVQRAFMTTVKAPDAINYQAVCDLNAHDGVRDGAIVCKYPNTDTAEIKAAFKNGQLDGDYKLYATDGSTVLNSVSFVGGQPDGKQEIYSPRNHKLVHVVHWSKGILDGEEDGFDEGTGNRTLVANWSDGKRDGEYTEYAPDGKQVTRHVKFVQGAQDGEDEWFYADSGKPRQYAKYVNGQPVGTAKAWDPDGRVVFERDYENGAKVPDSPELVACIEHLINNVKDANDITIGREDIARAACRENPNLMAAPADAASTPGAAPELAPLTAPSTTSNN